MQRFAHEIRINSTRPHYPEQNEEEMKTMKNGMLSMLTLVALLAFTGCRPVEPGQEISLKIGKSTLVQTIERSWDIEFTGVEEDSRCPPNALCIWAGRVVIELTVNGEETIFLGLGDLTTGRNVPYESSAVVNHLKITLQSVTPQASFGNEDSDYEIRLFVEEV